LGKSIKASFDAALNGIRNDVLMMSSLTDRMFQTAVEGLLDRDSDLCNQVVADDDEIDVLEKKVDLDGRIIVCQRSLQSSQQ
jgi:phosphate transport system protein